MLEDIADVHDQAEVDASRASGYKFILITDESDRETSTIGTNMDAICVSSTTGYSYAWRLITAGFDEEANPLAWPDTGALIGPPLSVRPWPEPEQCSNSSSEYQFTIGGWIVVETREPVETGDVIVPADCSQPEARYRVELGMLRPGLTVDEIDWGWHDVDGNWREHTQWIDLGPYPGAQVSQAELEPARDRRPGAATVAGRLA